MKRRAQSVLLNMTTAVSSGASSLGRSTQARSHWTTDSPANVTTVRRGSFICTESMAVSPGEGRGPPCSILQLRHPDDLLETGPAVLRPCIFPVCRRLASVGDCPTHRMMTKPGLNRKAEKPSSLVGRYPDLGFWSVPTVGTRVARPKGWSPISESGGLTAAHPA